MARPTTSTASAAGETVTVRMYRGILGDCFLLTHQRGSETYRALIDCGVLQCIGKEGSKPATKSGTERIHEVVADIKETTGGVLDLVVATHEHYDHLSGFMLANDLFRDFTLKALWVAWTENRKDDLANDIRAKRSKGLQALTALLEPGSRDQPSALVPAPALTEKGKAEEAREILAEQLATIGDLLQFYGDIDPPEDGDGLGFGAAARPPYDPATMKPRSCANALVWLAHRVGEDQVTPLEPGMQMRFGIDGRLTANVFGPPRHRRFLTKMDPLGDEVYLTSRDDIGALTATLRMQAAAGAGLLAAAGPAAGEAAPGGDDLPFAKRFWRKDGPGDCDLRRLYYGRKSEARRIDGEWLETAEALALKIDGDVNNTSLALAIEIPGEDVLLFPADAQVGNWESWHAQDYPSTPDTPKPPGVQQKSARDLLARTILYKVGHHGSHNATLKKDGLELMTSPDLVAMIPVVESVAGEQKTRNNPDGWAMPYDKLYARLRELTRHRIVRGDGDPGEEPKPFAGSRFTVTYGPQQADPLWVELSCPVG